MEGFYRLRLYTEISQRFTLLWPHVTGFLLDSASFSGLNMLYGLLLWGKLAMFYGIMRCLGVRQLYAYLITLLFSVYPVDSDLMSPRSIALQFSVLNLLAAIYLVLQYMRHPRRLRLAGVFLALAICIGAYEAQYALILVFPLLWWHRIRRARWREVNLTIIWYLAPAVKLAYLVLLALTGGSFYRSNYAYAGAEMRLDSLVSTTVENLLEVYRRTVVIGWGEALVDLARSNWLPLTAATLILSGFVTWYLWRREDDKSSARERQLFFGILTGMLLIVPAVGV